MSTQDVRGRKSTLLQRYQRNAESQDPLNQPMNTAPMSKSTSQRSLQNSTLLQRRYSKTTSQDLPLGESSPSTNLQQQQQQQPSKTSSQRSLDQSKLLQRYYKQNSQDSQDGSSQPVASQQQQQQQQQQYSSQKSLENSKLLQRYGPQANHSQEFTGLAPRESTPVARFQRSGSLDQDRTVRSSLLSKYTPRFGQSLDRNKVVGGPGSYSNYSSQHSLDQNVTQSQTFADYGGDHFDQYDSRNLRSRSTSLARGLNSRSMQRELGPMNVMEKENVPTEPITPETLPVVATTEPVMGVVASALPMPTFGVIPATPMVETSKPTLAEDTNKLQPVAPSPITVPQQQQQQQQQQKQQQQQSQPIEVEKPKRKEPVKPPRKDLAAPATVSIPIPTITTTIAKIDPPKALIPTATTKLEAPVVPKDPSPPLFSNRDRMDHYGSASNPSQSSLKAQPLKQQPAPTSAASPMNKNLLMPISDLSSRRSMTDLRHSKQEDTTAFALDIDEGSDRNDLRVIAKKKEPVKNTLASAFEQIAVLSVPQVSDAFEEREKIEELPPDRKLKKRDHTYHPSFVPKQAKLDEEERKKQAEKAKQEVHKQEQERRKEEEKAKKENERLRKESEKTRKEEEKRMKEEEKRLKAEDDKRRKDEEKMAKEQEKRLKEEEKRKKEEEKKKQKEEKKKASAQKTPSSEPEQAVPAEEESIDLASHLDHYSISVPAQPRSTSASGRPRSSGTPRGSQGALNRQTMRGVSSQMYGSQQSLDRSSGMQSKMLQRYAKRSGSQDFTHHDGMQQFVKDVHRSQGSLEQRVPRSSLLQRYTPKPLSASTATAGPAAAPPSTPRSTSQVSLDKNRIEKSSLLQRYKPKEGSVGQSEADQRMGAVVFQSKKPEKHATFDYRDHEYEPIGEPVDSKPAGASSLAPPTADQQRKLSSASLRVPGDADADTISMNELQKDIEDRYFNRVAEEETLEEVTAEPSTDAAQEKTSKMKAVMARAQESGKKAMARAQESSKSAMSKAQEGGKSLQQKLRKQTDRFKTKMSNINIKKDAAPLASPEVVTTPELEKFDFTLAEPKPEQETEEVQPEVTVTVEDTNEVEQEEAAAEGGASKKKFKTPEFSKLKNIHMPKLQKPEFKRPEFTKITKPKMPKLKTPDMSKFKRPEMPKFLTEKPDFSKLKMPEKIGTIKLQRSKSMKEPSDVASAASPSDASVVGDDDAKKKINYTDFSTFPRLLDKFKRQKSAPGNASVRASTPPPLEFTKDGKTTRPKGKTFISRWAEKSSEGAGSTSLFFTGSELGERESSVEKRMRQRLERADFDTPELPITAEQKQLEEYDKENREIHLVSAARHDEFMKRKPPMERQESDLASEEEKQFWASSLGQKIRQNIDMNSNDFDFLDEDERLRVARENEAMGLSARDRARFLGEPVEQSEDYDLRSTTPYSNKECQSSTGSSGIRRRKGVLEEIDDDEFFLRQKGISKDNIQMGEYISSAIKEGLGTPVNALAEMGRYDSYDQDMDASERMSMEYRGEMSFTDEFRRNADIFKTFPPDRPTRKQKKSYNEEQFEDDGQKVPYDSYPQEEEELEFYGRDRKYASEEPRQLGAEDERYIDEESIGNGFSRTGAAVPPTPPRRRKKRFRDVTPSELEPFENGLTSKPIYNSYTLGPETHLFNAEVPLAREESFTTPLPTPRRSRSRSQLSKAFDDDRTSRGAESYIFGAVDGAMVKRSMDMSESNGYATVRKDPPPRPPAPMRRRRSTRSLGDQRQFSTLPNFHSVSPQRPSRNYSTINPNRPPRMKSNTNLDQESMRSASVSKNDFTEYEDIEQMEEQARMHQTLATGVVANKMKDRPLPPPPRPPRDHKKPKPKPDHDDRHDFDGGAEKIVQVQMQPFQRVEEVEIAIQTDPLPEDYELDIEVEETLGVVNEEEAPTKTLREILREEQEAEIARARQLAEATNLMRDIQKFRDSTSSLSQQGSRPETPAAAASILERRVSVPTASSMRSEIRPLSNENLSEQDLAHAEDDKYIAELVKKYVSEEKVTPTESGKRQPKASPAPQPTAREIDAEKLREIEAMIVNEQVDREEFRVVQSEPAAPPRRRSLVSSSQDLSRSVEISPNVIEEIVDRLRTNEQQHIAELQQMQQQQLEELKKQQEEQQRLHDQKLEEQQKQLMEQQNQQLQETKELKEHIQQQQEQQKELILQLQQQREKELEQQRIETQRIHELEMQRAREAELRRAETQRIHELEMQRAREAEILRAKEAELLRAKEAELLRAKEAEMLRAMEVEMLRAREADLLRAREADLLRAREVELLKAKSAEPKKEDETAVSSEATAASPAETAPVTVSDVQDPSNVASEEVKETPPARPPPPRISPQPPMTPTQQFPYQEYMPYSVSPQPPPFYAGRNYSDDEAALPQAPHRRRRHHRSRRESTSEEEFQRDQRKQRHGTRSPEPTIPALGGQLIRACGNSIRETGDELMTILRASSKDENKRDLHIALIILIVIVAGLMALGMSAERDVHHHHWDYFNPPNNGRA